MGSSCSYDFSRGCSREREERVVMGKFKLVQYRQRFPFPDLKQSPTDKAAVLIRNLARIHIRKVRTFSSKSGCETENDRTSDQHNFASLAPTERGAAAVFDSDRENRHVDDESSGFFEIPLLGVRNFW